MFPPSLIARLFVRGSLKNTENGFEFKLKNIIESGTLTGLGALTVDETTYPLSSFTVTVGANTVRGDQITNQAPMPVRAYAEIHVKVESQPLAAGEHKVLFQFFAREAGRLQLNVTEPLAEA